MLGERESPLLSHADMFSTDTLITEFTTIESPTIYTNYDTSTLPTQQH